MKGRGAARNPRNRFERLSLEIETPQADDRPRATEFLVDRSRSIIATNESPDVGFAASVNPYRGCEHGCAYCFARPTHEYLGFSAGLDFESRILVKEDAPRLLAEALNRRSWKPQPLALSGVTDPYQPIDARLRLTRQCIEILAEFRNPVAVITKNDLVLRDGDLLGRMAGWQGAVVHVSITTLDPALANIMEPRTSTPAKRLRAIRELSAGGVPAGVLAAPVIPRPDRSRDAFHSSGRGGSRRPVCRLCPVAAAVRSFRFVRRLARRALSRSEGQGSPPDRIHSRRPAQRPRLRNTDARTRGFRRPDCRSLPDRVPALRPQRVRPSSFGVGVSPRFPESAPALLTAAPESLNIENVGAVYDCPNQVRKDLANRPGLF